MTILPSLLHDSMPVTKLHDLKEKFLSVACDWSSPIRKCELQFPESVREIRDGLYVATYTNRSEHSVWDNNDPPRELIKPKSSMLKYGKFENGVVGRYKETFHHLRRRLPNDQLELQLQRELLQLVLVLDLTPLRLRSCSCADVFEPFWNGGIESWLQERDLLVLPQNNRVESRQLQGTPPTQDDLMPLVRELQARIEAAGIELTK
jgi:hypothetical protein